MNDTPHDRISSGLRESAETIDVGDPDARLVDIRQRAKQRTNRRRGAVGALCAVALVGVGAVVVNDADDDGDIIRSADVDDASTVEDDDRAVDPAPATTTTTTVAPPVAATVTESASADSAVIDGLEYVGGPQWLVPWRDGFLAGTATYVAPPLPDPLPDAFAAVLTPEMIEFLESNRPMSVDEAFERMHEAGFADEMEAVFSENSEAIESIYGEPSPPTFDFEFSTDGTDWEPIDLALPDGVFDLSQLTSVGDRLVIVSQTYPVVPDGDRFAAPDVTVHATTDLVTWSSQELPAADRSELPDAVMVHRWPQQIAVQGDRWMLSVESNVELDVESLVSDEVRERMGREGWGYAPTADGVSVELYDEDKAVETIEFTWAELGISPELAAEMSDGGSSAEIWTATWDGDPSLTADPFTQTQPGGTVIALGSGFMTNGSNPVFSVDGSAWESMQGAPADAWISSTLAVDGGVVAFADGPSGPQIYLIDTALTWTPIEIPGAPERFYPAFGDGRASGAVVVDAGIPDVPEPEPVEISIPAGDYTLVLDDGPSGQTYRVLDAAGAVVTTETWSYDETSEDFDETGPFEFLRYEESGITALSPEDGSVLFEIGHDLLSEAYEEAYGFDETTMSEPQPDPWLLATADGTNWLVEQLDGTDMFWQLQAARNGSTVLVNAGGEWLTYDLS